MSSLLMLAVPGIILAAFVYHGGRGGGSTHASAEEMAAGSDTCAANDASCAEQSTTGRKLISPEPGSWTDGFYTTEAVSGSQLSTHALLYTNGGDGEPELVEFTTEAEILALGRLYNDYGQIVQSPSHFVNGTAR